MFDSARLKIERADHHISDLERQLSAFTRQNLDASIRYGDDGTMITITVIAPPPSLALVIGDAVHNLWSALDHLTWEVIGLDGGCQHPQLYFPKARDRASKICWMKPCGRHFPQAIPLRLQSSRTLARMWRSQSPALPPEVNKASVPTTHIKYGQRNHSRTDPPINSFPRNLSGLLALDCMARAPQCVDTIQRAPTNPVDCAPEWQRNTSPASRQRSGLTRRSCPSTRAADKSGVLRSRLFSSGWSFG
jgi:hypothetical protein